MLTPVRQFLDLIKFEHTVFALPFAYLGMVLAAGGWPGWRTFLWITVAMAAARTLAMGVNRLADRHIDAHNPRTANRPLVSGRVAPATAWGGTLVAGGVLALAAGRLGPLPLKLLPGALLFLVGYPFTKRFTWLSHLVLGLTDGLAPMGAWVAVRGSLFTRADVPAWLLLGAVATWIGGFDLIYACQDADFDREAGLHAIPARFGVAAALRISILAHALTLGFLVLLGGWLRLGWPYWIGLVAVAGLLGYEHRLVRPGDLSRLDVAFFNVNGVISVTLFVSVVLALAVTGCGVPPGGPTPLRVAVLPILDALPLYVAEAEGYFADQGVAVTFVPAASAAERDQLLQAGQVDMVITDLVALALYNRAVGPGDPPAVVAARYAMVPTARFAQFRVMAAPDAGLDDSADLRDVPIGVSEGTVIAYVTTRLLQAEGLPADAIDLLAVPRIPERMALLEAGELRAATLPEPLASLAARQGARVLVDDTAHPQVSCSLFAFRAGALVDRPEAARGFLAAVDRASAAINADKARWGDLLVEHQLVPSALAGAYTLPDYPRNAVPTEAQYADVAAWLRETDRLDKAPAYATVVDAGYMR